ncbi:MAG: alcohol dehydrogenase catalytic domain-containing protein [Candidatus Lokiarchaeota archaeon]|nr:alcohol dehydrogenase catalytic domain-containing protein [Candidatus Lokiarchaeota archaeon]
MKDDEVLVRVKACGICGTDIAIIEETLKTPRPIIPGHEITGIIEDFGKEVPDRVRGLAGKLVTTEINTNTCGKCFFCKNSMETQCIQRKALGIDVDGGMATRLAVRHDLIHELPDGLDPRQGTMIEPLAAAVQTFKMMPLTATDEDVVIIGAGRLGLLILQALLATDRLAAPIPKRRVLVIDHHDFKLDLARRFGATETVNSSRMSERELFERVAAFTAGGKGADVVVEATGNPRALNQAVYMARARGKVALKSTHGVPVPFDLTVGVVKEITFYTSRCGPFEDAIDLVRKGLVDLAPLVTEVFPLSRGVDVFKDLGYRRGNVIKLVLEPRQ